MGYLGCVRLTIGLVGTILQSYAISGSWFHWIECLALKGASPLARRGLSSTIRTVRLTCLIFSTVTMCEPASRDSAAVRSVWVILEAMAFWRVSDGTDRIPLGFWTAIGLVYMALLIADLVLRTIEE